MYRLLLLAVFFAISTIPAFAAEPAKPPRVSGQWSLTEHVEGRAVDERKGKITAIPKGVGYKFLEEEFLVPGEKPGSKRYTLPKGAHFRVSPVRIEADSLVVDILLAHTTVETKSDDGFSASNRQIDGRHTILYDLPFLVSLPIDEKRRYELKIVLRRD